MKNEPNEKNETLNKTLGAWKVGAPLPPRFQESVWQRIARAEAQTTASVWLTLAAWLDKAFRRPVLAGPCALVLLAARAPARWAQARQEAPRQRQGAIGRSA